MPNGTTQQNTVACPTCARVIVVGRGDTLVVSCSHLDKEDSYALMDVWSKLAADTQLIVMHADAFATLSDSALTYLVKRLRQLPIEDGVELLKAETIPLVRPMGSGGMLPTASAGLATAALLKVRQDFSNEKDPCWCEFPNKLHDMGHEDACKVARAVFGLTG